MIFVLSNPFEVKKCKEKILKFIDKGSKIEVKEVKNRSLSQNAFLHLLFAFFGIEMGMTSDETKEIVKHELGYKFESSGFPRPTSSYSKEEMRGFIDRFYDWAALQGVVLPTSEQAPEAMAYVERNKF